MRMSLVSAAVAALAVVAAPAAHAISITYVASLSGAAEAPSNTSLGTGTATVIVDTVAATMQVIVTFSGLNALTSNGAPSGTTASHIHCCTATPFTSTAGVATVTPTFTGFPLGVQSGSYNHLYDMTVSAGSFNAAFVTANGGTPASAFAALQAGLASGSAYLNIHSNAFGGGEIRGFLVPVPEPETYAMMLAGLAGMGALLRRRRG